MVRRDLASFGTCLVRTGEHYSSHWRANREPRNTSITRIDFNARSRVVIYTNRLEHPPPELVMQPAAQSPQLASEIDIALMPAARTDTL
ncbi:hypothetical protein [Denitrobaculum tricleocarpae]|uniref:Uncharacterized protein n=1 Tax=Denitrobaculum tricleocarpae TaxID=2591009 RepID=A0A545SSZ0_9PROT|nr:hypothetical protein [Denitrobaculum tricleocarpae]TQV68082.1 hypothetical protein FKG95_29330 [Denitrobaculum tricleocarpae]